VICDVCKTAGKAQRELGAPLTPNQLEELAIMHAYCPGYSTPTACDCAHRVGVKRKDSNA
jgi:hypothetical protein